MFRSVVPRLVTQARQASSRVKGVNRLQPSRAFGDRWLPLRRRNTWMEDYFSRPSAGASMFDHHMRRMGRLMDEMAAPRWAERGMPGWCRNYGFTDGKVAVVREDGHFKVKVDVTNYKPEEVSVRTSGERLIVRAESKRGPDKLVSTREFTVDIPGEVEADTFESLLSEDGVLTISARMKEVPPQEERIIDIKCEPKKKESESVKPGDPS